MSKEESKDLSNPEEFKKATPEEQETFLREKGLRVDGYDQPEYVSEEEVEDSYEENPEDTSEDKSEDEEVVEEVVDESNDESDSVEEDKQTEEEDEVEEATEDVVKLKKSYKALEAEFTRRSQELKNLKDEVQQLRESSKKAQTAENAEKRTSQIVDKLKEKNPEAAQIFESFRNEILETIQSEIAPELEALKAERTKEKAQSHISQWEEATKEFLSSPLAPLKNEFEKVLNIRYPTDEELIEAISSNPNLFEEIKRDVVNANLDVASELIQSSKTKTKKLQKSKRDADIENAKGSGKSKRSAKKPVDYKSDPKAFAKLSPEKQQKLLKEWGLFSAGGSF